VAAAGQQHGLFFLDLDNQLRLAQILLQTLVTTASFSFSEVNGFGFGSGPRF
jgi:hypothetical protein